MKLGNFNIHAISDGAFKLDGGQMFAVVPRALWERRLKPDDRNRVLLGLTCLLVQTGKHTVLIETGIGEKFDSKRADIYGVDHRGTSLPEGLARLGVEPGDINVVINTHLHFDHCGWNARRQGERLVPMFPRARYFVQRGEWEHACQPNERDRGSFVQEFFLPAEKQTEFLEGDAELLPGINVELLPGHTQYMQGVRIISGGEQAYFISDLVPTAAHLPYAWMMSFDLYPLETLANKKRMLPQLAAENALVVFPHDPSMPWARLVERNGIVSVADSPATAL